MQHDGLHSALLDARAQTHGPFAEQWGACQDLKRVFDKHGSGGLEDVPREALENIASKISRILVGNANFAEHWDDIAGYAGRVSEWIGRRRAFTDATLEQMMTHITPPDTPFLCSIDASATL